MKRYLLLVGSLVMLWGAEAKASNIEVETYHDSSKTDGAYTLHRQDDFTEHTFGGLRFDTGYASDTMNHVYFHGETGQSQDAEEYRTHGGTIFNDFINKSSDRDGSDEDKYKVKGDYQYSKHDWDDDREYDRDDKKDYDRDKDHPKHHDKYPHHYPKVPEPASLLLLGAGLAGIGIWKRRRG